MPAAYHKRPGGSLSAFQAKPRRRRREEAGSVVPAMRALDESTLAMAVRHVAEGKRIIARQRQSIARLKAVGLPTLDYEHPLLAFKDTLQLFEDHEGDIRARLAACFISETRI